METLNTPATDPNPGSRSIIPKTLFLVEQIRPRTSQIDNLRAAIAILLQTRTLEAVERVTDPLTTAHDALVLVVTKGALVADADQSRWTHVGIADGAFAIALVAEPADGDTGLLSAHNEIGVVAGHFGWLILIDRKRYHEGFISQCPDVEERSRGDAEDVFVMEEKRE